MKTTENKTPKEISTHPGVRYWGPKCKFGPKEGKPPTHLLLDGGTLYVNIDDKQNKEFCIRLAEDIDAGVSNFVAEMRTPVFKMHVDLDIYEDDPISDEVLHDIWVTNIQYVIKSFYEHTVTSTFRNLSRHESYDSLSVVICRTAPKMVEKNKKLWAKTGVHLIWPFLFATVKEALMLRSAFIQHFREKFGPHHGSNPYEDVFDMSIYTTNGLRMVGSSKLEKCTSCNGKPAKNQTCDIGMCDGKTGKYDTKHVYRVTEVLDRDGKKCPVLLTCIKSTTKSEVLTTSIRMASRATSHPFKKPEWFEEVCFHDEKDNHKSLFKPTPTERQARRALLGQSEENIKGAEREGLTKRPRLPKTDKRVTNLQKWLKNGNLPEDYRLPDVYRNTEIVDLTMFPGDNDSPYYIARTDSLFCMNKASEHNNNNIYFLINKYGLYQKCFCQCATTEGRKEGMCMDYRSSPKSMPSDVFKYFYPDLHRQQSIAEAVIFTEDLRNLSEETEALLIENKQRELAIRAEKREARDKTRFERQYNSKRLSV